MFLKFIYLFFFCVFTLNNANNSVNNLKKVLENIVKFRVNGKIDIPKEFKRIKLDIGLSYNAPMSQQWLLNENDLIVFGFEPNPDAVQSILNGAIKRLNSHGESLNKDFIGKNFFLIPCALGISNEQFTKFFVTIDDGCSSIYRPKYLSIEKTLEVPIFQLTDFFDLFPFDTHPIIEYVKIDAQGCDLDIVKSAGKYLSESVVFITLEPENYHYENTNNSLEDINNYMKSIGFIRCHCNNVDDPTFLNSKFIEYIKHNRIYIYQKG